MEDDPIIVERVSDAARPATLEYATPRRRVYTRTRHRFTRFICVVFGVVYPLIGLLANTRPDQHSVPVDWQNGQPLARLSLVTLPNVGWPIWPFLAIAWVSAVWAALGPAAVRRSLLVRGGLWLGVALGVEFLIVVAVGLADGNPANLPGLLAVQAGGLIAGAIVVTPCIWLERQERWRDNVRVLLLLMGGGCALLLIAAGIISGPTAFALPLVIPLLGTIVAAPLSIVGHLTLLYLGRQPAFEGDGPFFSPGLITDDRLARVLVLLLAPLHLLAWIYTFSLTGPAYRALPTSQPQYCFVATAAASSRRSARTRHRQLRTLRAFESWMRARRPRTHAVVRRHYNRIGPALASRITTPGRADAAHRALWLVEGLARRILRGI